MPNRDHADTNTSNSSPSPKPSLVNCVSIVCTSFLGILYFFMRFSFLVAMFCFRRSSGVSFSDSKVVSSPLEFPERDVQIS